MPDPLEDEVRRTLRDEGGRAEAGGPPRAGWSSVDDGARRRNRRDRGVLLGAVAASVTLVVGVVVVATGGDDEPDDAVTADSTGTTTPGGDAAAFCAVAVTLDEERPEPYVGSPEHVADLQALAEVSPDVIRPRVEVFGDFVAGGGIDPADPDSNLTERFPPEVQDAIADVMDYVALSCAPTTTATTAADTVPPTDEPAQAGDRPPTFVAVTTDGRVVVVDTVDASVVRDLGGFDDPATVVPDGEGTAFSLTDAALTADGATAYLSTCCEPAGGTIVRIATNGSEQVTIDANWATGDWAAPDPTGQYVAVGGLGVSVLDLDGRVVSGGADPAGTSFPTRLAWSPDGTQLAWEEAPVEDPLGAPSIVVAPVDADGQLGEPRRLSPPADVSWRTPAFLADGTLAVAEDRGTDLPTGVPSALRRIDLAGLNEFLAVGLDGEVASMETDADGAHLLVTYADGRVVAVAEDGTATELGTGYLTADW